MVEQELLDRCEYTIEYQKQEIDRLRAEIDRLVSWINGDADAHTTLQAIYLDPNASQVNRIKAAAASLPFEKPKLMSEPAPLELKVVQPLKELLESRRARQERREGLGSTEPPIEVLAISDGRYRNGNGSDSD